MEAIMDMHMQDELQKYLYKHGLVEKYKNIAKCGTGGVLGFAAPTGYVAIESNGSHVRATGMKVCHNLWCCPACATIGLAKQAKKLEIIIKAFAERDIVPFMVTITIPHNKVNSAKEVLDNVKKLQRAMFGNMFSRCKAKKDTTIRIKNYGKVSFWETTHGANGWHFHSHNLVFVHKDDFPKLDSLYPTWQKTYKNYLKKFGIVQTNGEITKNGFHCSVDAYGKIRTHTSVSYLTAELTTGKTKKTRTDGNRNIWEILKSGTDADMKLFLEYADATRFIQKVSYGKQILPFLGFTQEYFDSIRITDVKKAYRPVCVFTPESWSKICKSDIIHGTKHRVNIFKRALTFDFDAIYDYCVANNIPPPRRPNEYEIKKKAEWYSLAA